MKRKKNCAELSLILLKSLNPMFSLFLAFSSQPCSLKESLEPVFFLSIYVSPTEICFLPPFFFLKMCVLKSSKTSVAECTELCSITFKTFSCDTTFLHITALCWSFRTLATVYSQEVFRDTWMGFMAFMHPLKWVKKVYMCICLFS